jgi:magnesium chelatase family protein
MSLAVVRTRALVGLQAPEVRVEVHLGNGLPAFHIVGLPQAAVRESADRVRAALLHCGFDFPNRRLTVNLAPADLPKDSGRFDLPIAVGILAASGQVPPASLDGLEFVGELSLTGEIRAIRGALPMVLALRADGRRRRLVIPQACRDEAALVADGAALAAASLGDVCAHLRDASTLARIDYRPPDTVAAAPPDFSDVRGQVFAKRGLEVAAAGGHSVLMIGVPGAGKSMLAARFAGLLPPLDPDEALACAAVQSIAGQFDPSRWGRRPFRAPHHTASAAALVGGGGVPRPGEVTLAHHGVLFLDELPEFDRGVLEVLREPMESGDITVSRAARQATFPARFQLVAAMNPCPCGYAGSRTRACLCTPERIRRYQRTISGPLLDRIDIRIVVEPVALADLEPADAGPDARSTTRARTPGAATAGMPDAGTPPSPDGQGVRLRVARALDRQRRRQGTANARLEPADVDRVCATSAAARALLRAAAGRLGWSARGYHRVLRVARTIADLAGADRIEEAHLAEAIQFRRELSSDGPTP